MSGDIKKDIAKEEKDFIDHLRFEKLLSKNTVVSYKRDIKKLKEHIFLKKINKLLDNAITLLYYNDSEN